MSYRHRVRRAAPPVLMLAAAAIAATARPTAAQQDRLAGIESLIDQGRLTRARAELADWRARDAAAPTATGQVQRAFATLLYGRLATVPDSAIAAYRAVAIGYSTTPAAAEALLRLGQALTIVDSAAAAVSILERLRDDHPASLQRHAGALWLARAARRAGHAETACATARAALADPALPDGLRAAILDEQSLACRPPAAAPATPPTSRTRVADDALPFAVQTAALRDADNVDALLRSLERAGFTARSVLVPANALIRVRVGRFASQDEATRLARRLRDAGFDAIVVSDARSERPARSPSRASVTPEPR